MFSAFSTPFGELLQISAETWPPQRPLGPLAALLQSLVRFMKLLQDIVSLVDRNNDRVTVHKQAFDDGELALCLLIVGMPAGE